MLFHDGLLEFGLWLSRACDHYEHSAPTVRDYLDDLYIRLAGAPEKVSVAELLTASRLEEEGQWMQPNLAANNIYHLMERLGLDTTGQAGF